VRVVVVPQNSAAGSFWFDDLALSVTNNLISNPGFEVGAAGWTLAPQATIDTNPADAHAGNNSLQLTATAPWQGTAQYIPVTAGQTLTFSGWAKSGANSAYLTLGSYDANGNLVGRNLDLVFAASSGWSFQTATYLVPPSAVRVVVVPQNSAAGSFWFDDLSVTRA
jgi:hypothetical protein